MNSRWTSVGLLAAYLFAYLVGWLEFGFSWTLACLNTANSYDHSACHSCTVQTLHTYNVVVCTRSLPQNVLITNVYTQRRTHTLNGHYQVLFLYGCSFHLLFVYMYMCLLRFNIEIYVCTVYMHVSSLFRTIFFCSVLFTLLLFRHLLLNYRRCYGHTVNKASTQLISTFIFFAFPS